MTQIGFHLPDGFELFQESNLDNHVDIALRIIKEKGWEEYLQQSNYSDPVDFLVFNCGALKVGNCYLGKIVTVYPSKVSPYIQERINFYKKEGYQIDFASNLRHMSDHDIISMFHS